MGVKRGSTLMRGRINANNVMRNVRLAMGVGMLRALVAKCTFILGISNALNAMIIAKIAFHHPRILALHGYYYYYYYYFVNK